MRKIFDLTEDEKRLIREQYTGQLKVNTEKFSFLVETERGDTKPLSESITAEQMMSGIGKCFDSKKYPNLYKFTGGALQTIAGLLNVFIAASAEASSAGLATPIAVASGIVGSGNITSGMKKIYYSNKSLLDNELSALVQCVLGRKI